MNDLVMRIILFMAFTLPAQVMAASIPQQQDNVTVQRKGQENISVIHRDREGQSVLLPAEQADAVDSEPPASVVAEDVRQQVPATDGGVGSTISRASLSASIQRTIQEGNDNELISIYRKYPELFGCSRIDYLMALGKSLSNSHRQKEVARLYGSAIRRCGASHRVSLLEHGQGVMGYPDWVNLVEAEKPRKRSAAREQRFNHLWYQVLLNRVDQANRDKDYTDAMSDAAELSEMAAKRSDGTALQLTGWYFFGAKKYPSALSSFNQAAGLSNSKSVMEGKVLTLAAMDEMDELSLLVDSQEQQLTSFGLMPNALSTLGSGSYEQKNYARTVDSLVKLESMRSLDDREFNVRGWAYYHLKKHALAAEDFEKSYLLEQSRDAAKGLQLTLGHLNQHEKLNALADKYRGPLLAMRHVPRVDDEFILSQNLPVYQEKPEENEILKNYDQPYVRTGYMAKFSSGAPIFSRMSLRKSLLEGRTVFSGVHEFNVRAEYFTLNAGSGALPEPLNPLLPADPGFNVGTLDITGRAAYAVPVTDTRHKGFEWSLGYRYEGEGTAYLEAGQVIANAGINSDFKLRAGYSRSFDDKAFQIEAYRQPLRETMISYVGMLDPYQGREYWGQVSRNGGKISAYYALPYNFSLRANVIGEVRRGHNVASNNYFAGYLSLPYSLAVSGLNYFSFGPYMRWEHSQMNQNHYTIGHGNYFSPQQLIDWGGSAYLMSETGKRVLLFAGGSFGKQSVREDAAPYFPLTNNVGTAVFPNTYLGRKNMEYHYDYRVAVVVALADRWRVSGEFKKSRSWSINPRLALLRAFSDTAFSLSLTYHFADRGTQLIREDLPSYRLQPLY